MVLVVDSLEKHYDSTSALHGISFAAERGDLTVLVGPSGAGKTTLLRCIDGLEQPTAGTVTVDGAGPASTSDVGLVFQEGALLDRKSVLSNVLDGGLGRESAWRELLGWHAATEKRAAISHLHAVGLAGMADRPVRELSGGEAQRVGVARALHQRPSVLLADEPVASLDPETGRRVLSLLADVVRNRQLVGVVSLHQPELAAGIADHYLGLRDGTLVLDAAASVVDDAALGRVYRDD